MKKGGSWIHVTDFQYYASKIYLVVAHFGGALFGGTWG